MSKSAEFVSGALRSEKKLPYWRVPLSVLRGYAKRAQKGEKYDKEKGVTHNWKLGIESSDLDFYRQMFDHGFEHLLNAKELASFDSCAVDAEGEGILDHLEAALWNIGGLIEAFTQDPEGLRKALSQKCEPIEQREAGVRIIPG